MATKKKNKMTRTVAKPRIHMFDRDVSEPFVCFWVYGEDEYRDTCINMFDRIYGRYNNPRGAFVLE